MSEKGKMTMVHLGDIELDVLTCIKDFVNTATLFVNRLELRADRWVVDAKSIMGIFSLDLSKPIALYVEVEDKADVEGIKKAFEKYFIK